MGGNLNLTRILVKFCFIKLSDIQSLFIFTVCESVYLLFTHVYRVIKKFSAAVDIWIFIKKYTRLVCQEFISHVVSYLIIPFFPYVLHEMRCFC
jgi:hypothetical protein